MSAGIAQVLRDAAAELETNGWHQGSLHSGKASCLVGSVYRALGIDVTDITEEQSARVREVIAPVTNHLGKHVVTWNDTAWRTAAEVIKELLQVADLEDVT